jgi:hypothetical protein
MANERQAKTKRLKMAERAQEKRLLHFTEIDGAWIWHRKTNDGYTTIPRTLPLAMQLIDTAYKGKPAGHVLFCLWARSPDHALVTIENPATYASEAGFSGERAVDTWRGRMKQLRELGFIHAKKGASGEFHYVLLINPNAKIEEMHAQEKIKDDFYARFLDRINDIGAKSDIEAIKNIGQSQELIAHK